jgi:hypothetical protein
VKRLNNLLKTGKTPEFKLDHHGSVIDWLQASNFWRIRDDFAGRGSFVPFDLLKIWLIARLASIDVESTAPVA